MASGFLLVFLLCITVTNGIFFPWFKIKIHKVHHVHKIRPVPVRVSKFPGCPYGWSPYGSRCFIVRTGHKTMVDAEHTCLALGGNLASIHQRSEHWFIRKLVFKRYHAYVRAWIGLSDAIQEGNWLWTDGSKVRYTSWSHGEPNNFFHKEHCTEINWNKRYWNDISCHHRKPFVCAKRKV